MSTSTAINQQASWNPTRAITLGAVSGLIGGVVFGVMMAMMGTLPMVAMLVKSDSTIVGFVVHMVISAAIGISFGILTLFLPLKGRVPVVVAGVLYGIVWWVLGALILNANPAMDARDGLEGRRYAVGQFGRTPASRRCHGHGIRIIGQASLTN